LDTEYYLSGNCRIFDVFIMPENPAFGKTGFCWGNDGVLV